MQTTAEFTSNSTTKIKLSKRPSCNVAAKKLCAGVVGLKIPIKLTCDSWFCCNAGGFNTQISIELGCSPGKFPWKNEGKHCCKSRLIKVTN